MICVYINFHVCYVPFSFCHSTSSLSFLSLSFFLLCPLKVKLRTFFLFLFFSPLLFY
ncbi:hypothetical protein BDV36DRAFT_259726 [Aspergillus pseudocaelatus]|uniref:Uncharacterized protein n=1 Tax=Aspergillus pseudocaelatus TaxID=1825620 RepID=A0ABQ6WHN8_9EURO|nr:hypothetical protein BDV36DRAFT_259726 [Aspergillus pseudocaelatus]